MCVVLVWGRVDEWLCASVGSPAMEAALRTDVSQGDQLIRVGQAGALDPDIGDLSSIMSAWVIHWCAPCVLWLQIKSASGLSLIEPAASQRNTSVVMGGG